MKNPTGKSSKPATKEGATGQKKADPNVNVNKVVDDDQVILQQDWELDFSKKENVDTIMTKYEKAQNSRKNFIPED